MIWLIVLHIILGLIYCGFTITIEDIEDTIEKTTIFTTLTAIAIIFVIWPIFFCIDIGCFLRRKFN